MSNQKAESELSQQIASQVFALIPKVMQQVRFELRMAAKTELTVPQFRILARIEKKSTNHKDLADWIGVSLPAISRMITLLEKRGFVVRDRHAQDRRNVRLRLTEQGLLFYRECRKTAQKSFARKHCGLSFIEKERLNQALKVLGTALLQSEEYNENTKRDVNPTVPLGLRPRTK